MGQNLSTALLYAASAGNVEEIQSLIDRGADVNARDQDSNWLPIHYAAWGGHEKAVRELLVRGADVNGRDADSKTPLHYAVLGGHGGTVEALCNHGALVNAADKDGQTPLHKAAVQGQLSLAQELLARGANPDAKLQDGSTPAHLASWRGHKEVLSCLLQNGADANAATIQGDTPLHEASKAGHEDCCRVLLTHGASKAVLNADSNTPSDGALLNDLFRVAELTKPAAGEVQALLRLRQAAPSSEGAAPQAAPSAPSWNDGPIAYPIIDAPQPSAAAPDQAAATASDWEPQPEQDWEPVSPPAAGPSQGAQLMTAYGQGDAAGAAQGSSDPLWMIPGPVKWAAATVGGKLSGLLPWNRTVPDASDQPSHSSSQEPAGQEGNAAEVYDEQLASEQLTKLSQQEAEIAELRRRLEDARAGATSSNAAAGVVKNSSQQQPETRPAASCREVAPEDLYAATDGFSSARELTRDAAGTTYAGELQGQAITVWVPSARDAIPWQVLKPAADRLAGVSSDRLVGVRAVCRDGSLVLDHLPKGTLEDVLRSRAPRAGQLQVRLDWPARLRVGLQAAEGLADLHNASPPLLSGTLPPGSVLLTESLQARLRPPSLASLAFGHQAAGLSAGNAPEVRRGEPPGPAADVFSLGLLLLQLLTGSEPSGLLEYVRSAVSCGRITDVLDPCADCISPATALPLAKLALRCAEFLPEDRPDLRSEVLPELRSLAASVAHSEAHEAGEEEPPPHLVCPITQEVMEKPVILADGYTYEESAIREWLQNGRQVSPMTNAPLPHCNITPNYVIQSASATWREKHQVPNTAATSQLKQEVADLNARLAAATIDDSSQADDSAAAQDILDQLPDVPRTRVPGPVREEIGPQRQALPG